MVDDSGTFTDGTEVDKAFVDQLYDQVDDQCHSTTNPTQKPKATTDEVVAARGSKASLDARLDVSLEEDGTLKTQASLATVAVLQAMLGSRNVALNGDLEDWSGGGSAAPDDFSLSGAGATIARTGPAMGDTFTFGSGTYAAKITRAGADVDLTQIVVAAADIANYADMKGAKFSVAVNGKTAIASHLRVVIDDGAATTASSYHTGGNTQEVLTATHTISQSATKLHVIVEVNTSNGDAYVGGFNFVFSNVAPAGWMPLSTLPLATATRRGLIGTGTQTLAGNKTLQGTLTLYAAGTTSGKPPVTIHQAIGPGGNVGAGEDDLLTYSMAAGLMGNNGDTLEIFAFGRLGAFASTKTVKLYVGAASLIGAFSASATNNGSWYIRATFRRTDATNQRSFAESRHMDTSAVEQIQKTFITTGSETLANAITVKVTGQDSGSNDNGVICDFFQIKFLAAL